MSFDRGKTGGEIAHVRAPLKNSGMDIVQDNMKQR
jgi:hypothetical protein